MRRPFKMRLVAAAAALMGVIVAFSAPLFFNPAAPQTIRRLKANLVEIPPATAVIGSREKGAAHTPRSITFDRFLMGRYEVTAAEYACYLNAKEASETACPDLVRRGGQWRPRWGRARFPATHVSRDDAEQFCRWLSREWRLPVRLPTEAEWERAARGALHGSRYPWGWGRPEGRARFAAEGPTRVGRYPPNTAGLYDMAGNVYEWCGDRDGHGYGVACGGSWAERDPATLRVFSRVALKPEYRDRDVGFRILVETDGTARNESRL